MFHKWCSRLSNRLNRRREVNSDNDATHQPLDGGYGWLVVFGAFSVQFWVAGLVKSYGVSDAVRIDRITIDDTQMPCECMPLIIKFSIIGVICWDFGDIFHQFNGSCIMDTRNFIIQLSGVGAIVQRIVSAFLVPSRCFYWWPLLCSWSYVELLCD